MFMEKRKSQGSLIVRNRAMPFRLIIALALLLMALALPSSRVSPSAFNQTPGHNGSAVNSGALAAPLAVTVGSGWQSFVWNGIGPVFNSGGPFTFSSAGTTTLKVTDAFCKGDQFAVFDFGVQIGVTTAVAAGACAGPTDVFDPDIAFNDPTYSHGVFILGPGNHSITFQVITNPFSSGGAFFRVDLSTFDICLQDDSTGNTLQFSSTTGAYLFTNCGGFTVGGVGTVTIKGSIVTLTHQRSDGRVLGRIDRSVRRGTASIELFSTGKTFTITDRNTANNNCVCSAPV